MKRGGIILCGGESSRMGRDKATLPFGPELMLQRVARLLSDAVDKIVVVAAASQEVPSLPDSIQVVRDQRQGRGPLEGFHAGLTAMKGKADAVYATSCDVPLLVPAFVEKMFNLLQDHDVAVPREEKFHHPLAAVYRTETVLPHVEALLNADRLRPFFLFERCGTREVPIDQLRDVDPELATLQNLNRPEDYKRALDAAGV